ncbi:MAG: DUF4890 domain-containing protein [Saprospiraceae bacterium]
MQIIKKIGTIFVFALLTINALQAQRPDGGGRGGDPKERANQQTDRMIEALDLSAAQGEKIRALNVAFADKMLVARKEARESGDREAMRATIQTMRKEQNEKMKKYLTAEQVTKWEKILAERPERGERGASLSD